MLQNPFAPQPPDEAVPESASNSAGKNTPAEQGLTVPMAWKPTVNEPVPVVRCTGIATSTGKQCNRWSLRGTTVCRRHGGQLPSVREHAEAVVESARLQLMGMADDAVDVLNELIQPGVADAVRLKAVENILNRSGIKDAIEVKVEHSNVSSVEEITKRLNVMRERIESSEEDIVDAEEVNDVESEDGQETDDREDRDDD